MSKPQVYGITMSYTSNLDLIRKSLEIFNCLSTIKDPKKYLRPRLLDVLTLYIMHNYSPESKKTVESVLQITDKNLNVLNGELTKKGYLVRDTRNFTIKHLSKEMLKIQKYFLSDQLHKLSLIKFEKLT